ncbi:MAG: phospho-N-acetylmuramoyl-pentapeptide-transferase [Bulleidia sp.]|nr:phospho-N-acetylmuramoyl-pentapeptide-transferase [Bulleidia sp.]
MVSKMLIGFAASLALVLWLMPKWIEKLKKLSLRQTVSEYSLEEYKEKGKTPIMGGVLFIIVPVILTVLLCFRDMKDFNNVIVLLAFAGYGMIGFIDDWLIAVKKNNDGLKPWQKFLMQAILAIIFYYMYRSQGKLEIHVPFSGKAWHLGIWYSVLIFFMLTGSSNAVNLTDGMDGLSAGCTQFALAAFLVIAISKGRTTIAVFICTLMAALFGYLYYNVKPAKVFMGDTGSLALGACLAALAIVLDSELALIVIGGIFVIETMCVIIQQVSVRTGHGKVFVYTPIHYAFVIKGKGENQVVHMFWLVEACFALLGLFIGLH